MAITTIPDLPAGTLGFQASGVVSADDYRTVFDPAIKAAAADHTKVNLIYVLGDDFHRYSLGAMWQDMMLEGMPHETWGRVALVTDHSGLAEMIHLLAFLFPGELRIFALAKQSDAVEWASGLVTGDAAAAAG
ncbi:STAS/SEC14 domain-containing protein [Microbacterium rhizosphaerae]|uniref:STAS/SEC14 domain-containing protein n=1 Tax=Microbacterium rhizosphaerae TaxID=1678237 RepID=A0ABZ0SN51_9MICO|nr:STAS/SEC14 domain-containing protein [Microbacterium rhizosphaerae]WPR89644.1 STAS/SEC14 domain-containing protein [Microbacterium rhizosphaerae]